MADKKMNAFASATDATYLYAESNGGGQVKISKSDLFKGLMRSVGDVTSNLDNYTETGLYGINGDRYTASNLIYYGMLVVLNGTPLAAGGNPKVQILIDAANNKAYMRTKWYNSNWTAWKALSLTA